MYLKTPALVLRVTDYNDRDSLLTLLTASHGKLTAKARGLRRKNSPLTAPCQLLAYGEFTLFEYRGSYTVNEAEPLELFRSLRKDLTKLALGSYFAQVSQALSQEDQPNPELLALTLNCLYVLSLGQCPEAQIKAVFEFRAACLAGYTPDLSGCCVCGAPYPDRLDILSGRLVCSRCSRSDGGLRLPLTAGMLDALRYIASCDAKKLFSFRMNAQTMEALSAVSESYLSAQLEQGFSALDFYKSLFLHDES